MPGGDFNRLIHNYMSLKNKFEVVYKKELPAVILNTHIISDDIGRANFASSQELIKNCINEAEKLKNELIEWQSDYNRFAHELQASKKHGKKEEWEDRQSDIIKMESQIKEKIIGYEKILIIVDIEQVKSME